MQLLRVSLLYCMLATMTSVYANSPIQLITVENVVEFSTDDGKQWDTASTGMLLNYGDRIRTGEFSRAALQYPSGNIIRLGEFSRITLAQSKHSKNEKTKKPLALELQEGALYFFSRDKDNESNIKTPTVNAAIRGTEFELRVHPDQSTSLSLFEGEVELQNNAGQLLVQAGEHAKTIPQQAPQLLPTIAAQSYMQWYLYYPGTLDTKNLKLPASYQPALTAYQTGDLLTALERLPATHTQPQNSNAKLLEAAIILASGQIETAQQELKAINHKDATALLELISAINGQTEGFTAEPQSSTGWLARSYTYQAKGELDEARNATLKAVALSPEFGYAWARLARLQFSFGNHSKMQIALDQANIYNEHNPEVYVLQGFQQVANGKMNAAEKTFTKAIELAPNYPEAWLGKGLVGFNKGNKNAALHDLIAAAALQPNNSILRSYLAKGFAEYQDTHFPWIHATSNHHQTKAIHELELAKQLDPADPTPWLYSALIKRDSLRYIEALDDLQQSIDLNNNRSLIRSKSLLDEDVAVRRSNLAEIYQEAGLPTQALAEAGKAVQSDYTNFAAHDFLARVYRERFDETNINQRNDNALANEFFLRNILAPVGAGIASQRISNQEYSSLFNQQGLSGTIEASYDSREQTTASGIFTYQGSNYEIALEYEYNDWDEFYFNDDFNSKTTQLHFKFEPTAQDRFYSLLLYSETEQGDLRASPSPDSVNRAVRNYRSADGSNPSIPIGSTIFSPTQVGNNSIDSAYGRDPEFEVEEEQKPLFFQTYAREWNENHTSLFLYGWADSEQTFTDPLSVVSSYNTTTSPDTARIYDTSYDIKQTFELHTFELQHIWKQERNQLIAGARIQHGDIEDDVTMRAAISDTTPDFLLPFIVPFAINSDGTSSGSEDFERASVYTQFSHNLTDNLTLIFGLKYDYIQYMDGIRALPHISEENDESQISPQAGFIWQINRDWLFRGAYSKSMSGYQLEDRLRLEPTNIGGLTTNYATIAPSQLIGNMPGGTIDSVQFALTGKLTQSTYWSANVGFGKFDADRLQGQFSESIPLGSFPNNPSDLSISAVDQSIDYQEFTISTRLDHLLNKRVSIGASAYWQYAEIDEDLSSTLDVGPTSPYLDDTRTNLYIGSLYGRYQNPNGWFAQTDLQYWYQTNHSISPDIDNESAPNLNLSVGYRLQKQKGELRLSILNITDEEYELNPLSFYSLPPQERTFAIETRFSF